jgi:signal transduction histidine kinase
MRLAEFIRRNMEAILRQWEAFAASQLPAAARMNALALRDHAAQILEAVARDIVSPQTPQQQLLKSQGLAARAAHAPETAAQTHALLRAKSGFDINQLAAEYRALRATVLRMWASDRKPQDTDSRQMIRFNEAIDEALAESIAHFSAEVNQARNLLLGMLGHDMRSPLHAIQVTAVYLGRLNAGDAVSAAAARLINSGERMKALLDDLTDFNRVQLGLGIEVSRGEVDLSDLFENELQMLRAAHPDRLIELEVEGDVQGLWDANRLRQMLGNLVINALKYGATDTPVTVGLTGLAQSVRVTVNNIVGRAIEASTLDEMFEPLKRGLQHSPLKGDGGLGLGLFICRQIVSAHGGEISARSDDAATSFMVQLPRQPAA